MKKSFDFKFVFSKKKPEIAFLRKIFYMPNCLFFFFAFVFVLKNTEYPLYFSLKLLKFSLPQESFSLRRMLKCLKILTEK